MINHPVVFLPGWGFKASIWKNAVNKLNSKNHLLLDLPAYHENQEILLENLYRQIPRNSILIGWSLGGLLAIALCHKYPHHFHQLILIATTPKFLSAKNWPGISPKHMDGFFSSLNVDLTNQFLKLVHYPEKISLEQYFKLEQPSFYLGYLTFLFQSDFRHFFHELNIPTLVILGEKDRIVSRKICPLLTKLNPTAQIMIIKNAGHSLLVDHEETILNKIRNTIFMNTIASHSVAKCFNKAANNYDANARIQDLSGTKLIRHLCNAQPDSSFIIDLGCGTGKMTSKLADKLPYQKFFAIDIAEQMVLKAKENLTFYPISIECRDFQQLSYPIERFSIVFSNMALHWSDNLSNMFKICWEHLVDGGYLAFSIPLEKTFNELNPFARREFYSFNTLIQKLNQNRFKICHASSDISICIFPNLFSALKSIKATGATYIKKVISQQTLCGKNYLNKLTSLPQRGNYFSLTYQIGYFIVRKYND